MSFCWFCCALTHLIVWLEMCKIILKGNLTKLKKKIVEILGNPIVRLCYKAYITSWLVMFVLYGPSTHFR